MITIDEYYYKYLKYKKKYLELLELHGSGHSNKMPAKVRRDLGKDIPQKKVSKEQIARMIDRNIEDIHILCSGPYKINPKLVIFIVAHGTTDLKKTAIVPNGVTIIKSLPGTTMDDGYPIMNVIDRTMEHMKDKTVDYETCKALNKIQHEETNFRGDIFRPGDKYTDTLINLRDSTVFDKTGLALPIPTTYC